MSHPLVVHCKEQPYDVYIGRPSKWGNPFKIGKDGSRQEVIAKFEKYLLSRADLMFELPKLRGLTLGCYCAPQDCHGDVIAKYANADFSSSGNLSHPSPNTVKHFDCKCHL